MAKRTYGLASAGTAAGIPSGWNGIVPWLGGLGHSKMHVSAHTVGQEGVRRRLRTGSGLADENALYGLKAAARVAVGPNRIPEEEERKLD